MTRYAIVTGARSRREIEAYLPANYRIVHELDRPRAEFVIAGRDSAGWTLDGYVIPRLASGLIQAQEVGHDLKPIPA